jgi:hypothetical protein
MLDPLPLLVNIVTNGMKERLEQRWNAWTARGNSLRRRTNLCKNEGIKHRRKALTIGRAVRLEPRVRPGWFGSPALSWQISNPATWCIELGNFRHEYLR